MFQIVCLVERSNVVLQCYRWGIKGRLSIEWEIIISDFEDWLTQTFQIAPLRWPNGSRTRSFPRVLSLGEFIITDRIQYIGRWNTTITNTHRQWRQQRMTLSSRFPVQHPSRRQPWPRRSWCRKHRWPITRHWSSGHWCRSLYAVLSLSTEKVKLHCQKMHWNELLLLVLVIDMPVSYPQQRPERARRG